MIILIGIGIVLLLELGLPFEILMVILTVATIASTILVVLHIREMNRIHKIVDEMREEEENA